MPKRHQPGEEIASPILYTDAHPFCYDPSCPCHEDADLIAPINKAYQDGFLSADDASHIARGKLVYDGWPIPDKEEHA